MDENELVWIPLSFPGGAFCYQLKRLCAAREQIHGEARAGDDPAGTGAGSRPLAMEGHSAGEVVEGLSQAVKLVEI